ncbi:MAG: CsbD family protein [Candidatus Sericytochromatia bacterium]
MTTEGDLANKGIANQVKGKIREVAGIVTDNESEQAKGKAQTEGGKLQSQAAEAVKNIKDAVKGA